MPPQATLRQTFDPCLPCIASFTKHTTKQFLVHDSTLLHTNYETRNNNVKYLMRVNQDRVHILSPHACVVRHRCGCSGTPQDHQYAGIQDVDDSVAVEVGQKARPSLSVLAGKRRQVRDVDRAVRQDIVDHDTRGGAGAG